MTVWFFVRASALAASKAVAYRESLVDRKSVRLWFAVLGTREAKLLYRGLRRGVEEVKNARLQAGHRKDMVYGTICKETLVFVFDRSVRWRGKFYTSVVFLMRPISSVEHEDDMRGELCRAEMRASLRGDACYLFFLIVLVLLGMQP